MEEYKKVYDKIYNDLVISKYPDIFLLNQEGDINSFNTLAKRRKTKTCDGGAIINRTSDYVGRFFYDSSEMELIRYNYLSISFKSKSNHVGIDFLDYINSVLNADSNIFVRTKGLLVQDIRKYLLETRTINIYDTIVDNILVLNISKYFKKLEKIEFRNCVIKENCNFNVISSDIGLDDSVIESIQSFSSFCGSLNMIRTSINNIVPVNIYSKKIELYWVNNCNHTLLKELFLKCNFPNLKELKIRPQSRCDNYSFEDCFKYLPYSAPKLEELLIIGKVKSLEFLTKFKYLINCSIQSIGDNMDLFCPYVTDGKERKKIKKRNKEQIEIQKILYPNDDSKFIESTLEMSRILKLIKFNQLLSYSEDEKKVLLENKDIIEYVTNNVCSDDIEYYYKPYFDSLELTKVDSDIDCIFKHGHKIKILNDILYYYHSTSLLDMVEDKKNIVLGKDFIYNTDGKPIIFSEKYSRLVNTISQAKEKMKNTEISSFDLEKYEYEIALDVLEEFKNSKSPITLENIRFVLADRDCHISLKSLFMSLGDSGKKISYTLDYAKRLENRKKQLEQKEFMYKNLLKKSISDNYDKFSFEEKKCIYIDGDNYDDQLCYSIYSLKNEMKIDMTVSESLFDTINIKTNGLYKKYSDILKLISIQKKIFGYPFDVEVDKELIKKLN